MAHPKHSWQVAGASPEIVTVIDDWLGLTQALIRCDCGQYAFVHLVAWQGPRLSDRILAVRELDSGAATTYLANIKRDYCDLTRKQAETETLFAAASSSASLTRFELPGPIVIAHTDIPCNPPLEQWRCIQADDFATWADKMTASDETI